MGAGDYLLGTDVLGAGGLRNQYVVRVVDIDGEKLRKQLGGGWRGSAALSALAISDDVPKPVLDAVGLPLASKILKDQYGIDVEIKTLDIPANRAASDFFPGVAVGVVGIAGILALWKYAIRWIFFWK